MSRRVLVTDGEERAALAIARSLGRAGYEVHISAARSRSLAGASRYARTRSRLPSPLAEPERYLDELVGLVESRGVEVLIPVTDASLLAVLEGRERFRGVEIPFAEIETFRTISDKREVLARAAGMGIAVPGQWVLAEPSELDALLPELEYPLVLKPSRSVGGAEGDRIRLGVSYAAGPVELRERVASLPEAAFPLLLQRRIVGPGVGVFALIHEGRVLAGFAHRRLREKPPSGGVSVYSESLPLDPPLFARSVALLEDFGWSGPAMVEYKVDAATGTPYLMEVNGRFWGSLQLAIDAGVDFPLLLLEPHRAAHGPPSYRAGVRLRWWLGDLDHHLLKLREDRTRSVRGRVVAGWRAARGLLNSGRQPHVRNEVLRLNDPLPAFREALDWLMRR